MEATIRQVLEELFSVQPLMLNRSLGIVQKEEYSPVQMYVLITLLTHGEMTLSECSRCTRISKQQLSKLIDSLQARQLVTRRTNPANRRSILLSVPAQGMKKLMQYKEKQIEQLTPLFAQLSEEDLCALKQCFSELRRILCKLQPKENDNHA